MSKDFSRAMPNIWELTIKSDRSLSAGQRHQEKSWQKRPKERNAKISRVPRFVVTPKMITAAAVVLVAAVDFIISTGKSAVSPPFRGWLSRSRRETLRVEGNSITVSGFTDQDAKLTINDQPVMVKDNGEFQENILLQEGAEYNHYIFREPFRKNRHPDVNIKSNYEKPEIASAEEGGSEERASERRTGRKKRRRGELS